MLTTASSQGILELIPLDCCRAVLCIKNERKSNLNLLHIDFFFKCVLTLIVPEISRPVLQN